MAREEWKMAKEWIRSTGAVPAASKIHTECDLIDFVQALRDGVILCEVANHIRRGAVRDFTRTTHMSAFFCNKNIGGFLKACETMFGIPRDELFRTRDLYEVSDFAKVINTLSILSQSPLATQMGLKPFPPKHQQQEIRRQRSYHGEDDIYSKLEGAVADTGSIHGDSDDIYDPVTVADSEKIYDDIIKCSRESKELLTRESDKRSHVVNEILQTEENYVNALRVMIEYFISPLRTSLEKKDKRTVFMNTEALYSFHCQFLRDLKTRGQKLNLQCFIDHANDFLEYATYCSRMQEAQQRVAELCKDSIFNQIVEECQRKSGRKFPLHEQLIVPFQRILKYPLLLRSLLKDTPQDHPERAITLEALEVMEDIAKYINLHKKDDEMVRKISRIEASVRDDLCQNERMSDYGRFVNDGEIQVKFASDESKKAWSKRYAFLFDKQFLLCKAKGETFEIKEKLDLKKFKIDSEVPNSGRGKFIYCWNMQSHVTDGATEKNNCTMSVTSKLLKETWTTKLQMCIDAVQLTRLSKLGVHKFELTTFSNTTRCSVCKKLLCGLISQGYSCEGCRFNVHYDCIEKCPDCLQRSGRKQHVTDNLKYENQTGAFPPRPRPDVHPEPAPSNVTAALRSYPWFVGIMNRHKAAEKLQFQRNGTFLIRESDNEKGKFVLSLIFNNEAKHIKIDGSGGGVCISDLYKFASIPELIEFYKKHSLSESFPSLPTVLTGSVPAPDVVVARYAYSARNQQELTLRRDARISVIKRDGNWWYGELDGNFGFFPKTFVEDVSTMS